MCRMRRWLRRSRLGIEGRPECRFAGLLKPPLQAAFSFGVNNFPQAHSLLKVMQPSTGAADMTTTSINHTLPPHAIPASIMATQSDPPADENDDDLDDELNETGAVTNRSNGKSGTDTEAEPDKK